MAIYTSEDDTTWEVTVDVTDESICFERIFTSLEEIRIKPKDCNQ